MKSLVSDALSINQAPELFVITVRIVKIYDALVCTIHGDSSELGVGGDMFEETSRDRLLVDGGTTNFWIIEYMTV